jgi:HD-GYP domain-containing protein (c-di-GMP phosphodiesterase class II)
MVSDRLYRTSLGPAQALAELRRCAGAQFDPEVVEVFGRVVLDAERRALIA